jgi:hypothetical protein
VYWTNQIFMHALPSGLPTLASARDVSPSLRAIAKRILE